MKSACRALSLAALLVASGGAAAAETDVQRQLQQREQQQMELRLKMQQQLDRAATPPQQQQGSTGLQLRQLDRDQQQRLQIMNEQALRGGVLPGTTGNAAPSQRDLERQRAIKAAADELSRMEAQRRVQPATPAAQPPIPQ